MTTPPTPPTRPRRPLVGGRFRGERGLTESVELAMLLPVLLLVILLAVAGGRIALAQGAVQQAASDAARAASLTRTAGEAAAAAGTATAASLTGQQTACQSVAVTADTSGFAVPVGAPAVVRVTVACQVTFADLGVPMLPGSKQVTATMVSPLDHHRERG